MTAEDTLTQAEQDSAAAAAFPLGEAAWWHLSQAWGQYAEEEGMALARRAVHAPAGEPILEIGSLQGRSLSFMALALMQEAKAPTIYCVDLWRASPRRDEKYDGEANLERFEQVAMGLNYPGMIVHVEASSWEMYKLWKTPLGLLHIDGDHTPEGVERDLRYAEFLVPGGWLCLHDCAEEFPAVVEACRALEASGEWQEVRVVGTLWCGRKGW